MDIGRRLSYLPRKTLAMEAPAIEKALQYCNTPRTQKAVLYDGLNELLNKLLEPRTVTKTELVEVIENTLKKSVIV